MVEREPTSGANQRGTISSLIPFGHQEIYLQLFKSSSAALGSIRHPLLRPSRLIEHSRPYMPGDPIQTIDWRAYARTDQLLIRQIRDESTAKVAIALDLGSSMVWPSVEDRKLLPQSHKVIPSKIEIAMRIALYLAYVHRGLGNTLEFWIFDGDRESLPTRTLKLLSLTEIKQLFEDLSANTFDPKLLFKNARDHPLHKSTHQDISYWISDCLGDGDFMEFFRRSRRGVLFHTLSSLETDIQWLNPNISYYDERIEQKEFQGRVLQENNYYSNKINIWIENIREQTEKLGFRYHQVTDITSIESFMIMTADFFEPNFVTMVGGT
jgi:hypothetical protein